MELNPHVTVLLQELVSWIITDKNGIYLDGTVGYGGHSEAILKKISSDGKLIGMDLDPYALKYSEKRLSSLQKSYSLHNGNFKEYPYLLQSLKVDKVAGIIFDLGFSSGQLDAEHRGFSFQSNAPLDMRFNPKVGLTAKELLHKLTRKEISLLIKEYGEERLYRKISNNIVNAIKSNKMNTTFDLKNAVEKCVNPRYLNKSLARVFQSIRIKVNNEIDALKEALNSSINFLGKGGRIAVISFHSLEDRIVKKFFKDSSILCVCPNSFPICTCETNPTLKILTKKAIIPNQKECDLNSRSRSAKLRVAERI